jgi:hypothetical protein
MSLILVIGGYGGFGARLCRRLAAAGHSLIVAGRSADKAARFAGELPSARPLALDRSGEFGPLLERERPDLVVDAAGPFQGSDYRVPSACIATAIPYLDLADARDFVCGIGALDSEARAAGVAIVSGASTSPALTGAIARRLAEGLDRVDSVEIALSAANRAAGGDAVVAAALSYAGRPMRLWRGRRWTESAGWQEMKRADFTFDDGRGGLSGRLVALADLADLELLPASLPGRPAIAFRAGTELGFQMWALWLLSWMMRWGWVKSLAPARRAIVALYRLTGRIGGKRSAMSVTLAGRRGGALLARRWTVVAEEGEGLEIPTLAAELLAADILAGRVEPGARSCESLLTLERFEALLARLPVRTEAVERRLAPPLYARAMGKAWAALPPAVRRLHDLSRDGGAAGEGTVTRGRSLIARAVAAAMRFPKSGTWTLHVAFAEADGVERWTRDFGGHLFSSELSRSGAGVTERFGPLRFGFDLPSGPHGLDMRLRRWSFFRVPMPLLLAPRIAAREWQEDGRFRFEVVVSLPLVGRVIAYSGWLEPL